MEPQDDSMGTASFGNDGDALYPLPSDPVEAVSAVEAHWSLTSWKAVKVVK